MGPQNPCLGIRREDPFHRITVGMGVQEQLVLPCQPDHFLHDGGLHVFPVGVELPDTRILVVGQPLAQEVDDAGVVHPG